MLFFLTAACQESLMTSGCFYLAKLCGDCLRNMLSHCKIKKNGLCHLGRVAGCDGGDIKCRTRCLTVVLFGKKV